MSYDANVEPDLDMLVVRQRWSLRPALDVPQRVRELLDQPQVAEQLASLVQKVSRPRVAITAGSRGITDLVPVLRAVAERLSARGCDPFLVPCMGSHGGATPEGQLQVLRSLGVTETSVGAPVVSSLDVVELGVNSFGSPVFVARDLVAADATIVVNRIKPHTDFSGEIGSGIVKMLAVGMGKQRGADEAHRLCLRHGFPAVLEDLAGVVLARLPVLAAVAIIEDQLDQTALVERLDTSHGLPGLLPREIELQRLAAGLMPRLPFDDLDVLIVDLLGKEVSGAGMDPNVIGRRASPWFGSPPKPRITRIYARGLTDASGGNALGVGMADFVQRRLLDQMDPEVTAVNCISSADPEDGRVPIAFDDDRAALRACLETCGAADESAARVAWIGDTAHLETLAVSLALADEVAIAGEHLETVAGPCRLGFDRAGDLLPFRERLARLPETWA